MEEFKLNKKQAALILEVSADGEIKVDLAEPLLDGEEKSLAAVLCQVIATKLVNDERFQDEILSEIDMGGEDSGEGS